MKKTLFDVYTSAQKAALNTINTASSYATENAALEAFNADGNDPADWDAWKAQFDGMRRNLVVWKQSPAPSAKVVPPAIAPSTPNQKTSTT
jgi:hypothetical protein